MEDRAVCIEDLVPDTRGPRVSFFGVYDGHNGNAAVDFASSKLHRGLHAALSTGPLRYVPSIISGLPLHWRSYSSSPCSAHKPRHGLDKRASFLGPEVPMHVSAVP